MEKVINVFILIITFLSSAIACSKGNAIDDMVSVGNNGDDRTINLSEHSNFKTSFNVLVIGNSLSNDAWGYTPFLLREVCPDKDINLNILYRSGTALKKHWELVDNSLNEHVLERCGLTDEYWQYEDSVVGSDVIKSRQWDLVVIQQGSTTAHSYDDTQPFVRLFANYIHALSPTTPIAYMFCQSRVNYSSNSALYGKTMDEVWDMQANLASRLLEEGDVDCVIPCGTAIQNARHTRLDSIGKGGHLTYDGTHLQEGLPCMVDAYTSTQSLLNILSISGSVSNSELRVSNVWGGKTKIPGRNGSCITGTDEDYALCLKCASKAIATPFIIADMNNIDTGIHTPTVNK